MTYPSPEESLHNANTPLEVVVAIGRMRRQEHRRANAFFAEPGELSDIYPLTARYPNPVDRERLAVGPSVKATAEERLRDIQQRRDELIAALPALEDEHGRPTGVSAVERLAHFLAAPEFRTLDIARAEHEGGWTGALRVDAAVQELIDFVAALAESEDVVYEAYPITEDVCEMHVTSLGSLGVKNPPTNLLYCTRNTLKATVVIRRKLIEMNKRTEFFIFKDQLPGWADNLRDISVEDRQGLALTGVDFWTVNALIYGRPDPSLEQAHSAAYVSRKQPRVLKPKIVEE